MILKTNVLDVLGQGSSVKCILGKEAPLLICFFIRHCKLEWLYLAPHSMIKRLHIVAWAGWMMSLLIKLESENLP